MLKAVDCSTRLTIENAICLKESGYHAVGRYLGAKTYGWSKAVTAEEVHALHTAGLSVYSIWEGDPTYAAFFTEDQGKRDAADAVIDAQAIGQPAGTPIYFTVDYDAQAADLPAIESYFRGVQSAIHPYVVGVYGGKRVLDHLHSLDSRPAYFYQTLAWSGGERATYANVYQYAINGTVCGVSVDYNDIYGDCGEWGSTEKGSTDTISSHDYSLPTDVARDTWYASGVQFVIDHKLLGEFAGKEFKPDEPLTRAQAAVFAENLYHLLKK